MTFEEKLKMIIAFSSIQDEVKLKDGWKPILSKITLRFASVKKSIDVTRFLPKYTALYVEKEKAEKGYLADIDRLLDALKQCANEEGERHERAAHQTYTELREKYKENKDASKV